MKNPVAIIAFNRPHYLRQLLQSLQCQMAGRKIYMFLDGGRPDKIGEIEKVNGCGAVFRENFPDGFLIESDKNLGIPFNTNLARNTMFNVLNYEGVIFLEDDVVLNSYYLELLDYMAETVGSDDKIGMISGFGDHDISFEDQHKHRSDLIKLVHVWAYFLKKNAYNSACEMFNEFLSCFSSGKEYLEKDSGEPVFNWRNKFKINKELRTSQDKSFLASLTYKGFAEIATYTNNLKYIGATGEHFHQKAYDDQMYGKMVLYDKIEKDFIWNKEISNRIMDEQQKYYFGDGI